MRGALRDPTFVRLFAAETQSIIGDQLARVALSILVFERTASVVLTAGIYAATFLPAIAGGIIAGGLGDRMSQRGLMVALDLARAALFALMALPKLPLPAIVVLLVVAVGIGPVFTAAQVSRLASQLDGELFRGATALRLMANQSAQVVGFVAGGALVMFLSPEGALLINGGTFAASALLIRSIPSAVVPLRGRGSTGEVDEAATSAAIGRRELWRDRRLRRPFLLSLLVGFLIVPEGVAVPVGRELGASATETGLLFAAIPLGSALGAVVLTRVVAPRARRRCAQVMAIAAGVPLVIAVDLPLPTTIVLWGLTGVAAAYQVETMATLVTRLPAAVRAQLLGVIGSGLIAAQGVGLIVFGVIGQATNPRLAIALAGALASLGAIVHATNRSRALHSSP